MRKEIYEAQQALAQGHRIGFIGGTDNHSGWPTMHTGTQEICGVTGVIANELNAKSIHNALHARSCYATTGARIVAQATLNGALVGTEHELEPDTERRFSISLKGTAPIERVEIVSFGCVTHAFEVEQDSSEFTGEWVDDRPNRPLDNLYYYVRARQVDGHCIWMSPWWIDQV